MIKKILFTLMGSIFFFISPRGIISSKSFIGGFCFLYFIWIISHFVLFVFMAVGLDGAIRYSNSNPLIDIVNGITLTQAGIDAVLLYCTYCLYRKRLRALEATVPVKEIFWILILYIGAMFDSWSGSIYSIARTRYEVPAYSFVYASSGNAFIFIDLIFYLLMIDLLLSLRKSNHNG